MYKNYQRSFSWDFYSYLIIIIYCLLQILRWRILPQFMDIYYHLLTAWGFIQAGGYSGWDFWQYAPVGRIHIYPPFFHTILVLLMKLGFSPTILAKLFEAVTPVVFLTVLWRFLRRNYDTRLAFFAILTLSSSFSFYLSLLNHIPATLALIFGFLALDQLFQKKTLRSVLLLTLCFYTHIGISWFISLTFVFYGLLTKQNKKPCFVIFLSALMLSLPILYKQLAGLRFISAIGMNLNEIFLCQIKIIDYILAFFGLIFSFKTGGKYRLFFSFLLASLIFLSYPYRFFSAEGYLPILLLLAVFLRNLYQVFENKKIYLRYFAVAVAVFILFFSPAISIERPTADNKPTYKVNILDSAFSGMLFARGESIWFPKDYLSAADLIKNNSESGEIIYSTINITGIILASISGRATANALLPEIKYSLAFDPLAVSKIIVFAQDDDYNTVSNIVSKSKLVKIGENKLFVLYKNPYCSAKIDIKKASLPFGIIWLICFVFIALFWQAKN